MSQTYIIATEKNLLFALLYIYKYLIMHHKYILLLQAHLILGEQ